MARRGINGVIMRAYGARDHEATVTGTELLAPHFLRVRMTSPTLLRDVVVAPAAYVRFWMPDPDDPGVEHQRGYTLTEADPATGAFAVDFVLHDPAGPASTWARRAEPGTGVRVTTLGSTRFDLPPDLPAGYLLIGDAASVPAINGILGVLPPEIPVELYLEEHRETDRLVPLADHPRADVHWVPRRGEASLAAAIPDRDWSDWYAWATPESGSLKHLRARLRDEFGFPRSETHAQAYWYHGRAFGSNRRGAAEEPVTAEAPAETAPRTGATGAEPATTTTTTTTTTSTPTPPATAATAPSPAAGPKSHRGAWRARAGGRLLRPLRPTLIAAGVAQALVTLVQLAPFVLMVELARRLTSGKDTDRLWALGAWAVGLTGAGVLLASGLLLWLHRVDARFARDLRQRLLTKLSRLPLGWFDSRGSGRVKQIVQDDTLSLHYLVTHAVPDAVAAVVAPVAVLVYLFSVDWRIALPLLLPVLVYIVAMTIMVVRSGPRTAEAVRWSERMNVEACAYLEGQPVVRVFGGAAASSFRTRLGEYIGFLDDWQRPLSGQKTFIDLATRPATFLLLICALGTPLVATGRMDPVSLLPFLLLGTTFGARLMGIGYGLSGLREGLLAARRIQVTLDEPELTLHASGPEADADREAVPEATAGRVEFDRVDFSYRPGVPVLEDVSLTLEPGTVTALVGPSGSGKSTLAALLARFHDVTGGTIRIDGRDVRGMTADELYARVGFVFQRTRLVHGTVRENIALAVPDADEERITAAARAARIHDRITRMPDGYDTVLGPDAALSGGERQRLTIARALLADTPVLVLDEATAFADPESEYLVQRALNRLTAGRTVLVIAHRLHTITGVDRIVVLDHGRIAQTGTHTGLLADDGRYRQLWDAATAGVDRTGAPR
ncbi:ABC transporter ATP-binding protein/permease [Streptomyces sp. NPDC058861]|uniref:ABC transporter ATP-binding protein/permease n=1 Tax=Streptomyces sp. NPDC058861 TaxID=3346653 RepID=UPI0036D1C061